MADPITFSVNTANRSGTFQTAEMVNPGGYARIFWRLDIPVAAEYEDPARSYTATLLVDGVGSDSTWVGGRRVNPLGVVNPPPAIAYDISGVSAGAKLQVRMMVPIAMRIGIRDGVIA